jgi:hypothetical protein
MDNGNLFAFHLSDFSIVLKNEVSSVRRMLVRVWAATCSKNDDPSSSGSNIYKKIPLTKVGILKNSNKMIRE